MLVSIDQIWQTAGSRGISVEHMEAKENHARASLARCRVRVAAMHETQPGRPMRNRPDCFPLQVLVLIALLQVAKSVPFAKHALHSGAAAGFPLFQNDLAAHFIVRMQRKAFSRFLSTHTSGDLDRRVSR